MTTEENQPMPLRSRRIARPVPTALAAGTLAVLTMLTASCANPASGLSPDSGISAPASIYKGTELAVLTPLPAVTLKDAAGQPYDLKARNAGKLTLVYFGYTNCPDVCPTTMADIAAALRLVSATQRAKVSVVFITTDPERDTGPVMKTWLAKFDPTFTALGGTVADVDNAAKLAGVPVNPPIKNADGTVEVDHGSQVTAFAPDGKARVVWLQGMTPQDIAHDIPLLESIA
jgi:protein SCO1